MGAPQEFDVPTILAGADERALFDLYDTAIRRGVYATMLADGQKTQNRELISAAEQMLAELPQVSALDGLAASRRLIELITGARWLAMRNAREAGATWQQLGDAIGTTRQAAQQFYASKIAAQEHVLGDLHDAEQARAALADDRQEIAP